MLVLLGNSCSSVLVFRICESSHWNFWFKNLCFFPIQVNLRALQSLVSILPALATQSGALVPPLVSALTANLASKNINIYNATSEAMKELIKQLGITDLLRIIFLPFIFYYILKYLRISSLHLNRIIHLTVVCCF